MTPLLKTHDFDALFSADDALVCKGRPASLFALHWKGREVLAAEVTFSDTGERRLFTLREPTGEFHLRDFAPLGEATRLDVR